MKKIFVLLVSTLFGVSAFGSGYGTSTHSTHAKKPKEWNAHKKAPKTALEHNKTKVQHNIHLNEERAIHKRMGAGPVA